eukprot:10889-Pelagomonas_calceolata.AAC.2
MLAMRAAAVFVVVAGVVIGVVIIGVVIIGVVIVERLEGYENDRVVLGLPLWIVFNFRVDMRIRGRLVGHDLWAMTCKIVFRGGRVLMNINSDVFSLKQKYCAPLYATTSGHSEHAFGSFQPQGVAADYMGSQVPSSLP